MLATLRMLSARLELTLAGTLPAAVRRNMHIELVVAMAYGAFYASSIAFIPVVLRNLGASSTLLAVYTSLIFMGSVLASLSIMLMRRRRPQQVMVVCWAVGRSVLLFSALVTQALWLVVIGAIFWVLEAFPGPGYTRIMQQIYPSSVRGKAMSIVRLGRVTAILLITPVAGWALDIWGYRILFPLAALVGVAAALLFARVDVGEDPLPARQTKALSELWQILRQDRRFAFYLFVFVIFGTGTLLSWTLYPIIQVDRLHLSYGQIGVLGLFQSLFWLLGFLYWGQQVDRRGGLYVMRATCAINILIPGIYLFASTGWMLIPAFIAQGVTMAGWDMGMINTGIQLADPERVTEYAGLQATVTGLRGMVVPLLVVLLLSLGIPYNGIFAISVVLISVSWILFGYIRVPLPSAAEFQRRQRLRYRWPLRPRTPRP